MKVRFFPLYMDFIYIEFIILLLGLIIIMLEVNISRKFKLSCIFFSFIVLWFLYFNPMIWHINFSSYDTWKLLIISVIFISVISIFLLIKDYRFEIICLNLMVLLGSLIIITCDHLLVIYLGLELQTFSLFILISKNKTSIKGSEAGLKYFILGALSSGLYLLGVCFIFSSSLTLSLKDLYFISSFDLFSIKIGSILIILSLFFKLALFPLHFWIPDIYEGSSWEVLGLISTIPKISVLILILQLNNFSDLLLISSLLSIVIGTFGALNQTKLKRLLAYSGISHMGFILLGVSLISNQGYEISFVYLSVYLIIIISFFYLTLITILGKNSYIIELANINNVNKLLALTWAILFLSIAGIPPLSGFISKWFILWFILSNNYIISSLIAILFSAIAAGYYLRIVKIIYFQNKSSYITWNYILNNKKIGYSSHLYVLGFYLYIVLFLIINPNPIVLGFHLGFNYFV